MDFLKQHYDKVALAGALIVLIISAVLLSFNVSALNSELEQEPNRAPKSELASHLDEHSYSNAIAALQQPPLWTNAPSDLFAQVAVETTSIPSDNTNTFPVILTSLTRKPFKLLFKAYSYETDKGEGYNFQINFQFRARTFFIRAAGDPVKDRYEDTGYRIMKFERKNATVNDPSLGGKHEKDVSELTVQHEGEKPVVLALLQETEEQEPVAKVRCGTAGVDHEYRRGQRLECNGKIYKVVDIDPKQMIIVDTQTEEQHVIKP